MKNLIPLTAYVLEQKQIALENPNTIIGLGRFLDNVSNYAKFLSMPLTEELLYECIEDIHRKRVVFYLATYSNFEEIAINHTNLPLNPNAVSKYKF